MIPGTHEQINHEWRMIRERLDCCTAYDNVRQMPSTMQLGLLRKAVAIISRRPKGARDTMTERLDYLWDKIGQALAIYLDFDERRWMPSRLRVVFTKLGLAIVRLHIKNGDLEKASCRLACLYLAHRWVVTVQSAALFYDNEVSSLHLRLITTRVNLEFLAVKEKLSSRERQLYFGQVPGPVLRLCRKDPVSSSQMVPNGFHP